MATIQTRYVGAEKLLKAIDILPAKMQDNSLSERHKPDLGALLEILQMQKPAIQEYQKTFPDGDRNYPIKLNDTQHRFLLGI